MTRLGKRLAVRLRSLTRPQVVVLMAVCTVVAATMLTAATGHLGAAVSLVALLLLGVLLGVLHLSRWMNGVYRANQAASRDLRTVVEQMQRRVVAAVEKERLAGVERHEELSRTISRGLRQAGHGNDLLLRAQSREIEAMFQLFRDVAFRAPMPSSGDFALNPTDLLEVLHLVRLRRPQLVVELGSGTSTVWLAYALEQVGGRLVSLDHDEEYCAKTRALLSAHGLTGVAEVRLAPLTELTVDGRPFRWYDQEKLTDLRNIDLLLIDGPPAATGPDARFPAMHTLESRLSPVATIVLDDANRPDEQEAIRRWTEAIPALTPTPATLGRHAVLSYSRPGVTV